MAKSKTKISKSWRNVEIVNSYTLMVEMQISIASMKSIETLQKTKDRFTTQHNYCSDGGISQGNKISLG